VVINRGSGFTGSAIPVTLIPGVTTVAGKFFFFAIDGAIISRSAPKIKIDVSAGLYIVEITDLMFTLVVYHHPVHFNNTKRGRYEIPGNHCRHR
jgi:hypothetical protein